MGTRSPLDRSAAHHALLGYLPEFATADLNTGSAIITAFLADFYASSSLHMNEFAQSWRLPVCAYCHKSVVREQGHLATVDPRDGGPWHCDASPDAEKRHEACSCTVPPTGEQNAMILSKSCGVHSPELTANR